MEEAEREVERAWAAPDGRGLATLGGGGGT